MTQGIHPLAASMVNQLNRAATVSNNLANVNTVGFKEDFLAQGSFNQYLTKQNEKDESIDELSAVMNTIPKIDQSYSDNRVGGISQTGNPLDFAITSSDKYFKVKNIDGDILLTRDGSFKNINNQLVTANGSLVLNKNNQPINLSNGTDDIFKDIALVSTNLNTEDKVGNNSYKISDKTVLKNEDSINFIKQGYLEHSNVNTITSMTALIEAQREFEQSQKAITGIDDINKKVIADIGTTR